MDYHRSFHIAIFTFILNFYVYIKSTHSYLIPTPTFELLKPTGVQISIPDEPGIQLFGFHGNVNRRINMQEPGEINVNSYRAKNNRWTVSSKINVQNGGTIYYWLYVQVNGVPHTKQDQSYTIEAPLIDPLTSPSTISDSEGQLIFEENFNILNTSLWTREIKMPLGPDYEFCVYHNENHNELVKIENGILSIKPIILEDFYGVNITSYGTIQLLGCTSDVVQECSRHAVSYSILPPVISARLTTKNSFSFQYGKIEIRAKFPEGDWLYPELWLDPRYSFYGTKYASGRVLLGLVLGNENFISADLLKIFDSRNLKFGLIYGSPDIYEKTIEKINDRNIRWNKDFHTYTTVWTADGFVFQVDGQEIGRIFPGPHDLLHNNNTKYARKISPFDQEFYISIGVGVGGVRFFPDNTISQGYSKPWKNTGAKAMLKFWNLKDDWLPSWRQKEGRNTAFEIDYIKVWSL